MLPGLALAVRPAGAAEVARVKRRAEGAERDTKAPLTLEGPARTIRERYLAGKRFAERGLGLAKCPAWP